MIRMHRLFIVLFTIVTCICPQLSFAEIILPPGHTWEYTFTDPISDSTWNISTGIDGNWSLGAAPFGNMTEETSGTVDFIYNTFWAPTYESMADDLWVRTIIDLTNYNLSTVTWDLGVDNGFKFYTNGVLLASDNAEGYTYRWEYSGDFSGVSLIQGENIIAVALEDHGGGTAFDMQITGAIVPEPISSILFVTGGTLLAGRRYIKRKKKA